VRYTAYGTPSSHPIADINGDGTVNSSDQTQWAALLAGGTNSAVYAQPDLNADGLFPDQTDEDFFAAQYTRVGAGSVFGMNKLSSVASRKGYAGYEWDMSITSWHVRHRVLDSMSGKWTARASQNMPINSMLTAPLRSDIEDENLATFTLWIAGDRPDKMLPPAGLPSPIPWHYDKVPCSPGATAACIATCQVQADGYHHIDCYIDALGHRHMFCFCTQKDPCNTLHDYYTAACEHAKRLGKKPDPATCAEAVQFCVSYTSCCLARRRHKDAGCFNGQRRDYINRHEGRISYFCGKAQDNCTSMLELCGFGGITTP
jgi:hypothetical protein